MSKKIRNKLTPFVALPWDVLNSRAYKELPASAAKALPYFLGKVKLTWNDPERYTEVFTFSYPEGKGFGFASGTFSRTIDDLIKHGFIVLVEKGGLRGNRKGYNKFRLARQWKGYGIGDKPLLKEPLKTKEMSSGMAIYRIPSKNGKKNDAEKGPTTPKSEIKAVSDVS